MLFPVQDLDPKSLAIHQRALNRARRYLVAEAELLEAIMEVDRNRTFEKFSLTHLTPYCVKYLGLTEDVAACFVRVERKSRQVPELKEAVAAGKITVTKAKAIVSVVNPENQQDWIEKASTLSKEKLERAVAQDFPSLKKPEKAKPTGPDRVRVEFELSQEEMEFFRRAQDLLSQKNGRAMTLAETQKELLKAFLDRNDPVRKAERAAGAAESHRSRDRSDPGANLPASVIHEVNRRDQGKCQARFADGALCTNSRWIHFHHLKPRVEGGENSPENLITLCSSHHRMWHKGKG